MGKHSANINRGLSSLESLNKLLLSNKGNAIFWANSSLMLVNQHPELLAKLGSKLLGINLKVMIFPVYFLFALIYASYLRFKIDECNTIADARFDVILFDHLLDCTQDGGGHLSKIRAELALSGKEIESFFLPHLKCDNHANNLIPCNVDNSDLKKVFSDLFGVFSVCFRGYTDMGLKLRCYVLLTSFSRSTIKNLYTYYALKRFFIHMRSSCSMVVIPFEGHSWSNLVTKAAHDAHKLVIGYQGVNVYPDHNCYKVLPGTDYFPDRLLVRSELFKSRILSEFPQIKEESLFVVGDGRYPSVAFENRKKRGVLFLPDGTRFETDTFIQMARSLSKVIGQVGIRLHPAVNLKKVHYELIHGSIYIDETPDLLACLSKYEFIVYSSTSAIYPALSLSAKLFYYSESQMPNLNPLYDRPLCFTSFSSINLLLDAVLNAPGTNQLLRKPKYILPLNEIYPPFNRDMLADAFAINLRSQY